MTKVTSTAAVLDCRPYRSGQRGATLVMIVLGMPIFLALVFMLVWLPQLLNARSTFTFAVAQGGRLAATRGNPVLTGFDPDLNEGLIQNIHTWQAAGICGGSDADWALVKDYYGSEGQYQTAALLDHFYNGAGTAEVMGGQFCTLPVEYLYAIAYINQVMRESLGENSVRFPCNPYVDAPPYNGDRCLFCKFMNPQFAAHFMGGGGGGGTSPWDTYSGAPPQDRYGIMCFYAPPESIATFILRLLNTVVGGSGEVERIVFRRQIYYDLPRTGNVGP